MKSTSKVLFGIYLLAFQCLAGASNGSSSGGGGDIYDPSHGSAWFLGNGKIRYCFEVAKTFGVSNSEIEAAVDKSFQTWSEYITKKKINLDSTALQNGLNFSFNRFQLPKCNGNEDLKFYFGTTNLEIDMAKQKRSNPIAFAERTSYDPVKGWGKGYIWLALPGAISSNVFPDWTKPNHLLAILIHEMGHVLGSDHMDGTIMTEFIGPSLFVNDPHLAQFLNRIDWTKELDLCSGGCKSVYKGSLGDPGDLESASVAFQRLTGRIPQGTITSIVNLINDQLSLSIGDETGTVEGFNLEVEKEKSSFVFGQNLFRVFRSTQNPPSQTIGVYSPRGEVLHGKIQAVDGRQYSVQVYRNSNETGSPMVLRYILNNHERVLFWSQETELP